MKIISYTDYPQTDVGKFMQWLDATIAYDGGHDVLIEMPNKSILTLQEVKK